MVTESIPQGYKQTEIGVIPEDWDVKPLRDCLDLLTDFEANGSFEDVAKNVNVYNSEKYAWYVRATDLENNSSLNDVKWVDKKSYIFLKKTKLVGGELLITKRGEIGKVYLFIKKTDRATVGPNLYLLKLNQEVVPKFLFYYFKEGYGNVLLKINNASTTLGALYKEDVKSISIPYPDPKEQSAIATALSQTDELIQKLDKLITKKKDIKKGAMQELLTGKKRLPGFSGEWEEKELGEVVDFMKGAGLSKTKISTDGKNKCLLYGELFTKYKEVIKEIISKTNSSEGTLSKSGDILMPGSTTTVGVDLAVASAILQDNVYLGGDVNILRKKKDCINSEFLANYLTHVKKHEIAEITQGTTIIHLYGRSLKNIKIIIPPTKQEQSAIAKVLSDMDSEIEELEQKRNKYQMIKEGMMQQLLTGRIRLKWK